MEDSENFDLAVTQAIKNNETCAGDHQLSSAFNASFPSQIGVALQKVDAGKNTFNNRVCFFQ